ncbi:MAG: ABC transporter permease [Candidatus Eremiobacteraeota bacterium]|nr:ABC transporter permease [Candidatus Eremiobacteraeota bacterium]
MNYLMHHVPYVASLLLQHIVLTWCALAVALGIALPLGFWASRHSHAKAVILAVFGTIYTLPSLAVLALLVPLLGLNFITALVALVAYAQMILVRNITVALEEVPFPLRDAARGLGMTRSQTFFRVELPQALPVMIGGVRIAAVSLIAIANLAAWIGAGGLGVMLFLGMQRQDNDKIVIGSVLSAVLALTANALLYRAERRARTAAGVT